MNSKPIGFFDSGVGGISVLKTARAIMPFENFIYYGDDLNAPYGEKTEEQIQRLTLAAGDFLYKKGVKAIVMACNTATSAAVIMMRERYSIPVISMEPAVKPALFAKGQILVLATPATVTQARYLGLIERLCAQDRVVSVGCSGLVECIENGRMGEADVHACLGQCIPAIGSGQIGAVVIGCTHYSLVEPHIKSYVDHAFDTDCVVFDGRHGTARRLEQVLIEQGLQNEGPAPGSEAFFSSCGDKSIQNFEAVFHHFEP